MSHDVKLRFALQELHKKLFNYDLREIDNQYIKEITCPVCDNDATAVVLEKDLFTYVRCPKCSMVYMNPRLNDAATYSFYNSEANEIYNEAKFYSENATEQDDKINFGNLKMINQFRGGVKGKLLEIGSARGYFLQAAQKDGYDVHGVELNKKNWEYSHEHISKNILNVDLFEAQIPDETFDVIYMRDVIEHIPNPRAFLAECFRIAKPGCTMFIETHNIDSWINQLVHEKHTVIFGFEHINHWSPRTLTAILQQTGFAVEKTAFSSTDFTVQHILHYLRTPSFSTIFPPKKNPYVDFGLKLLSVPFRLPGIKQLERWLLPQAANWAGRGSVMKSFSVKNGRIDGGTE